MILVPAGVRIYLAMGATDMRKGFDVLALLVHEVLKKDPYSGHLFLFRGCRANKIKTLYHDTNGLCLFANRLQRGRFVWPVSREGVVMLTLAEPAVLVEGLA